MNELLRALYDHFYDPYEDKALESEVDVCHKALNQALSNEDRRLVLRIIDIQSLLAEQKSIDSFIAGFKLAWKLWDEVAGTSPLASQARSINDTGYTTGNATRL